MSFYRMPPRKGERSCSKCGETKPLTAFTWNKHNGCWMSWCSRCVNYYQGHTCEECGTPVSNPGAKRAREQGRPVLCVEHGNKAAGERKRRPLRHGTTTGYTRGCRCDECRVAEAAARRRRRREVTAGIRPPVSHGVSGYSGGCRCDWCREARNEYGRALRRRKAAA